MKDLEEQRKFFDEFANSRKFSPQDAEKWYSVNNRDLLIAVLFSYMETGQLLNFLTGSKKNITPIQ
jgi:hypothetical protein